MRTQEEIVAYLEKVPDFLGFQSGALLPYLSFDLAKAFLVDTATKEDWGEPEALDEETVKSEMREYMSFAIEKVENHRGISATRSVEKMKAWLWLLGDDELYDFANQDDNYLQYGAPILAAVCKEYSFPTAQSAAFDNMANGRPCRDGCDEGCGR